MTTEKNGSTDKEGINDLSLSESENVEIKTDHPEAGKVMAMTMAFAELAPSFFLR